MNETPRTAGAPSSIDTTVVHSARVWNYWLGGKDHCAVDREVGAQIAEQYPVIIEVARLVTGLPPGSYLALCEGSDTDPEANAAMDDYNQAAPLPYRVRSPDDIAAFFRGLEMVEPGLVACPQWRPDDVEVGQARETLTRCGIGRKPDAS